MIVCFAQTIFAPTVIAESSRKPNLVLIMADDMGYADASSYGNDRYQTPNIDRLAREGLRLLDYHSSGVVCSPTRAGLVTGRYQQRAGVPAVISAANHRHEGLHAKEVTFAERLKAAGYQTAVMGKWHLGYQVKFNPLEERVRSVPRLRQRERGLFFAHRPDRDLRLVERRGTGEGRRLFHRPHHPARGRIYPRISEAAVLPVCRA